jgi:hypothetical protein
VESENAISESVVAISFDVGLSNESEYASRIKGFERSCLKAGKVWEMYATTVREATALTYGQKKQPKKSET